MVKDKDTGHERRMLFTKGFGDGAKMSAHKLPDRPDYMIGWEAGHEARREAVRAYVQEHDLPPPNILRTQEGEK